MHGCAEEITVGLCRLGESFVYPVVTENTAVVTVSAARAAGDAAADRTGADMEDLGFDALALKRIRRLAQGGIGAAEFVRTAVQQ